MPGHRLLAWLGKRVLCPGVTLSRGRCSTASALSLRTTKWWRLPPGLGSTVRLWLERSPRSDMGVERDEAAGVVRSYLHGSRCQWLRHWRGRCSIRGRRSGREWPGRELSVVDSNLSRWRRADRTLRRHLRAGPGTLEMIETGRAFAAIPALDGNAPQASTTTYSELAVFPAGCRWRGYALAGGDARGNRGPVQFVPPPARETLERALLPLRPATHLRPALADCLGMGPRRSRQAHNPRVFAHPHRDVRVAGCAVR